LTVIAIDGTSGSGKGTLSKRLAAHYGLRCLDTGKLYRAVALEAINAGVKDEASLVRIARAISVDQISGDKRLDAETVGTMASAVISRIPAVRAALLQVQRDFARGGAVLDGRDIGTVVVPNADYKIFVTASLPVRAARRQKELEGLGIKHSVAEVEEMLRVRDLADMNRPTAPLVAAPDAYVLDTSELSVDEMVQRAVEHTTPQNTR
jgi:cytidylate kinase